MTDTLLKNVVALTPAVFNVQYNPRQPVVLPPLPLLDYNGNNVDCTAGTVSLAGYFNSGSSQAQAIALTSIAQGSLTADDVQLNPMIPDTSVSGLVGLTLGQDANLLVGGNAGITSGAIRFVITAQDSTGGNEVTIAQGTISVAPNPRQVTQNL